MEPFKQIKKQMIETLEEEIAGWDKDSKWIMNPHMKYGVDKNSAEQFLEHLKKGKFDAVINNIYWYGDTIPNLENLLSWQERRTSSLEKGKNVQKLTPENFIVHCEVLKMINICKNELQPLSSHNYRYTTLSKRSAELLAIVEVIADKTITIEYSWRDALRIVEKFKAAYEYPVLLEEILQGDGITDFFNHIEGSDKIGRRRNKRSEIPFIKKIVNNTLKKLDFTNIGNMFSKPSSNYVEEYIRRMIISQLDIPELVHHHRNTKIDFRDILSDNRALTYEEMILHVTEAMKKDNTFYDDKTIDFLFGNLVVDDDTDYSTKTMSENMKKSNLEAVNLSRGVLFSLTPPEKELNIKEMINQIQKALGIKPGRNGYFIDEYDANRVYTPNGDTVFAMSYQDIPSQLILWQTKYKFLYNNGTDAEFIKGCTEIMSEMSVSQMFVVGNKRTAKCLFNSMLISRGIVPPIIDMCENDYEFWDCIVDSREEGFRSVIERVLVLEETMIEQFKKQEFGMPVINKPDAKRHIVKATLKLSF